MGSLAPPPLFFNLSRCLVGSSLRIAGPQHIGAAPTPIGSFAGCRALSFQGGIEAPDQGFAVEGLGQIADRPGLQSSRAITLDGESGDENERQAVSPGQQEGLQFEPAHGRHSDIRYHARCVTQLGRSQELFRRRECMDGVAKRSHEVVGRGANGSVIVDD